MISLMDGIQRFVSSLMHHLDLAAPCNNNVQMCRFEGTDRRTLQRSPVCQGMQIESCYISFPLPHLREKPSKDHQQEIAHYVFSVAVACQNHQDVCSDMRV